MALRNIKITRDIVQTGNKVRAFNKSELCTLPPQLHAEFSENATKLHFVSHSLRNECKDATKTFTKINATEKNGDMAPPLAKLKKEPHIFTACTLGSKGDEKILTKNTSLVTAARLFSTKKGKTSGQECKKPKCQRNPNCPKWFLDNCPKICPPQPSCLRQYQDPCCTKKMAPYPSYSELCAYCMEDDPSECHQCPWQRCGGVDDIKPQKKGFHTCARAMNMAMIPHSNSNVAAALFLHRQCDARKEPCKEPPPRCKKREEVKKEKCPEKKEKPKDKCSLSGLSPETWTISGSINNLDMQRCEFSKNKFEKLKAEIGVPSNLAEKIVYEMKDCPKEGPRCPDRTIMPSKVIDQFDERFKPKDPCCEKAKRGRQPRKRPKVFVPEPRDY